MAGGNQQSSRKEQGAYAASEGLRFDQSEKRLHHEIYLSDPRRVAPERLKTVLRIPVRPA